VIPFWASPCIVPLLLVPSPDFLAVLFCESTSVYGSSINFFPVGPSFFFASASSASPEPGPLAITITRFHPWIFRVSGLFSVRSPFQDSVFGRTASAGWLEFEASDKYALSQYSLPVGFGFPWTPLTVLHPLCFLNFFFEERKNSHFSLCFPCPRATHLD